MVAGGIAFPGWSKLQCLRPLQEGTMMPLAGGVLQLQELPASAGFTARQGLRLSLKTKEQSWFKES
jgi:hypothetical protein